MRCNDDRNKMVQPSPSWCLSFLIILIYLVVIPTARKYKSVEQLTDSAVYLPLLFRLFNPIVSLLNDNGTYNPAICFQSLFLIGQR